MKDADIHAGHLAAGVWADQCPACAQTDELCRQIEAGGEAAALASFKDLSIERRREVLRRLGERDRLPAATLGALFGVAGGPDAA